VKGRKGNMLGCGREGKKQGSESNDKPPPSRRHVREAELGSLPGYAAEGRGVLDLTDD
jgi:hypothetical protein